MARIGGELTSDPGRPGGSKLIEGSKKLLLLKHVLCQNDTDTQSQPM